MHCRAALRVQAPSLRLLRQARPLARLQAARQPRAQPLAAAASKGEPAGGEGEGEPEVLSPVEMADELIEEGKKWAGYLQVGLG